MPACSMSCSSSISPTISSTTSSMVTRPSVPPNSSTTMARWMRCERIRASRSRTPIDSGMNKGSRISAEDGPVARRVDGRLEDILDVNHADHFVEALAVDGQTAVLGFGKSPYQIVEGNRRRHGDHVAASDADVARRPLAEVEQVAEHLPLGGREIARDRALNPPPRRSLPRSRREASARCPRRRSASACRARAAIRLRRAASPSARSPR